MESGYSYDEMWGIARIYNELLRPLFPGVYVRPYQGFLGAFMIPDDQMGAFTKYCIEGIFGEFRVTCTDHSLSATREYYPDVWAEATGLLHEGTQYKEEEMADVPDWITKLKAEGEREIEGQFKDERKAKREEAEKADAHWQSLVSIVRRTLSAEIMQFVEFKRPDHFCARWNNMDFAVRIPGHAPLIVAFKYEMQHLLWHRDTFEYKGQQTDWKVCQYVRDVDGKLVEHHWGWSTNSLGGALAMAARNYQEAFGAAMDEVLTHTDDRRLTAA